MKVELAVSSVTTWMPSSRLQNYVRAHRKRLALSQDEVAFLLGTQSGAKVSRYENFVRVPNLETALAYEAIFRRPVRELFVGLYHRVEKEVAARAKTLVTKMNRRKSTPQNQRKREIINSLARSSNRP